MPGRILRLVGGRDTEALDVLQRGYNNSIDLNDKPLETELLFELSLVNKQRGWRIGINGELFAPKVVDIISI